MMFEDGNHSDVFSPEKRSSVMRSIGRRDTRPEMQLRRLLHAHGFRYRLKRSDLPFRPDVVFPSARLAVFVHGCFWHGHACHLFHWPRANADFWRNKIERNMQRDMRVEAQLLTLGWRSLTVWECMFRGRQRASAATVISAVQNALNHSDALVGHFPHGLRAEDFPEKR